VLEIELHRQMTTAHSVGHTVPKVLCFVSKKHSQPNELPCFVTFQRICRETNNDRNVIPVHIRGISM
jgi:hypothetical protein